MNEAEKPMRAQGLPICVGAKVKYLLFTGSTVIDKLGWSDHSWKAMDQIVQSVIKVLKRRLLFQIRRGFMCEDFRYISQKSILKTALYTTYIGM